MKDKLEWIKEYYPNIKSYPSPDYVIIAYLEYCIHELEIRLAALEPNLIVGKEKSFELIAPDVFPPQHFDSEFICKCGKFVGIEGDSITCANCGGLLF